MLKKIFVNIGFLIPYTLILGNSTVFASVSLDQMIFKMEQKLKYCEEKKSIEGITQEQITELMEKYNFEKDYICRD